MLTLENARGDRLGGIPAGTPIEAKAEGERVALSCAQPRGEGRAERYIISSSAPISISLAGKERGTYQGQLAVSARAGRLALVNKIGLEEYLRGVLPFEIPTSFHPEALKAQAIAARTYAVAGLGRHKNDEYDLCDGSHCQVYLGMKDQDARLNAAISDTAGLIVTYQGRPIHAVYHDVCGGRTAGNESAWVGSHPLPYLRPVLDGDDGNAWCARSPRGVWTRRIPRARLGAALERFGVRGPVAAIRAAGYDENGRPQEFEVSSESGEVTVLAGALRSTVNAALGWNTLPSADFEAAPSGEVMVFTGRGNGHGVGLCQWGADGMARAGKTAAEILAHYYQGTKVEAIGTQMALELEARNHRG